VAQVAIEGDKLVDEFEQDRGAFHRLLELNVILFVIRQLFATHRHFAGPRHEITAHALHPAEIDLRRRDPPRQMELALQRRIGRFRIGAGARPEPTDRPRQSLDLGRMRRIGRDRPGQSVTQRVARHLRLAGRRPGAGAVARIGAVGGAFAFAHRAVHTGRPVCAGAGARVGDVARIGA
jgi:hypothetical protein